MLGRRRSAGIVGLVGVLLLGAGRTGDGQGTAAGAPCESFTAATGEPADVAALSEIVRHMAQAYEGSEGVVSRVVADVDRGRFVGDLSALERQVQRDFDRLRDRRLVCRWGLLSIEGDLAVLQSDWEKRGRGPGGRPVGIRGPVTFQFRRQEAPPSRWAITGLLRNGTAAQAIFGAGR
jgi:hypothetical protein